MNEKKQAAVKRRAPKGFVFLLAAGSLCYAGCWSSPIRVQPPNLNPERAAQQAMAEFDQNKDGFLDADELTRCRGLNACALDQVDKNGDGKLSQQEIRERLSAFRDTKVGLIMISCQVFRNDAPLVGATATLVPEKFLQPALTPASGLSDDRGAVTLQVEGQPVPGVAMGWYRIQVSLKSPEGQELVPTNYNTETVLGYEVSLLGRGANSNLIINLSY